MHPELIAERIYPGPATIVPVAELLPRLEAGEIIVARQCLQATGHFALIADALHGVMTSVLGPQRAETVARAGIEQIHRHVSGSEVCRIAEGLMNEARTLSMTMVRDVARNVVGLQSRLTIEEFPNVRLFVPHDAWVEGEPDYLDFERRKSRGKVTIHGPHLDAWFGQPSNLINVWTAIGPVLRGNGMTFFPEMFGNILPPGEWGAVRSDQILGRGLNFALDPGDALLFHVKHMHASEINQTSQTRVVISGRFTTGDPILYDRPWYSYLPDDQIPGQVGMATPPCMLGGEPPATPPANLDTSSRRPLALPYGTGKHDEWEFPVPALRVGEIRPLGEDLAAVRMAEGVFVMGRRCPHAGADLTAGYVEEGKVHCPMHNLAIDPATGASACRVLTPIPVYACKIVGKTVRVTGPPALAQYSSRRDSSWRARLGRLFGARARERDDVQG